MQCWGSTCLALLHTCLEWRITFLMTYRGCGLQTPTPSLLCLLLFQKYQHLHEIGALGGPPRPHIGQGHVLEDAWRTSIIWRRNSLGSLVSRPGSQSASQSVSQSVSQSDCTAVGRSDGRAVGQSDLRHPLAVGRLSIVGAFGGLTTKGTTLPPFGCFR